ncbi:MAG: hypothetical protein ACRDKE_01035 [Solirubrobacterales bacterium]
MLHDSLRALTDDAARLLEDLLTAGAEIPFEVGDAGQEPPGSKGSVTMFAYRPLTAEFVASHADQLRSLPTFENAAHNLARTRGVIAYLRVRNEPVLDVGELTHARLGVLAFLSSVWKDAERFEYWGDRFERAYSELESIALAERLVTTVFIPVHGVALSEGSINLGAGVELISAEELEPACADRFSDQSAGADCFCSISVAAPSDAATPMPAIRLSARALLTALRLFRPGSVALGMTAQADIAGSWHQVSMPFSGRSREDAWLLRPTDEEELRQFVNAVRRVERRTRISWALKRFETGLERTVPAEGLTDFLLALRALLEAEDDRGKAALPARVSALCAQDAERIHVREEVEAAFALERLAIDGQVGRADRKRLEKLAPLDVIAGAERHLRALLHDLVCGYLATDLKNLADEILTADGEPAGIEIVAEDPTYLEPVPDPGAPPAADPTQTVEFEAVFDDTAEISAIDMRDEPDADFDTPRGDVDDNVWTLRPAAEIAPAPEVSDESEYDFDEPEPVVIEEATPEMHALADELAEKFDAGLNGTMESMEFDMLPPEHFDEPVAQITPEPIIEPAMEDVTAVPAWEASPERKPIDSRRADVHESVDTGTTSGFTFDFKKVDTPDAPTPVVDRPDMEQSAPDFPIPEFGVPIGRGPAATRSDEEVDGREQHTNFREIMNENFEHPRRAEDETATTPVGRDGRPHLVALDGAPEQAAPRIVHPGQAEKPLIPLDPDMTVEYDVLSAETSAEENAQLAWSQQFLGNRQEPTEEPEQAYEPEPEPAPEPRLLPAVRPVPDLVLATFPKPAEQVEPEGHSSQDERTRRIGPATVEFRPVVDPDKDDPDDFAGAV